MMRFLCSMLLCSLFFYGQSQDVHWSQQQFSSLQYSPSMVGLFKGSVRSTALHRNQWRSVPVDYRTYAAAFEKKLPNLKGFRTTAAVRLLQDKAGDAGLNWTQADLIAAASKPVSSIWTMSIGLGLTLGQRSFDISKLSFKNQWDGSGYNNSLPSKEAFGRSSGLIPALQSGVAMHYAEPNGSGRTEAHFFVGFYNLNAPKVSFEDTPESQLSPRITAGGWAAIKLLENSDIVLGSFFQKQDQYFMGLVHAGYRHHIGSNGDNPTFWELGTGFRFDDAVIPSIRFDWNAWSLGMSYDINISSFDVATQGRGGLELALMHRIVPVEAPRIKKACPLF